MKTTTIKHIHELLIQSAGQCNARAQGSKDALERKRALLTTMRDAKEREKHIADAERLNHECEQRATAQTKAQQALDDFEVVVLHRRGASQRRTIAAPEAISPDRTQDAADDTSAQRGENE